MMSSSDGACALAALSWWTSALCLPLSLPDEVRRYAACTRAQVSVTGAGATPWCADAYRRAEHERGADLHKYPYKSVGRKIYYWDAPRTIQGRSLLCFAPCSTLVLAKRLPAGRAAARALAGVRRDAKRRREKVRADMVLCVKQ